MAEIHAMLHYPDDASGLVVWADRTLVVGILGILAITVSLYIRYICWRKNESQANIGDMELMPLAHRAEHIVHLNAEVYERIPGIDFQFEEETELPYDAEQCPLCIEDFVPGEILRSLPPCEHVFHLDCIRIYLAHGTSCPCCRQLITYNVENA